MCQYLSRILVHDTLLSCIVDRIDSVLIDQQSVGKRSLHLIDTAHAKKRWTPNNFVCVPIIFERVH
jgi:hypothetical protein